MKKRLMLGAVAYCPNVVTIWEGFKVWFAKNDLDFDMILYSNYEALVEGQFAGHVDIAWNSPLAWVQVERVARQRGMRAEAIAMRDTDQDLTSVIVVREDSGIHSLEDLKGKTVGVGAKDSPQATLIPLNHLAGAGLQSNQDFKVLPFDRLVGKHGDHIGGERDAATALMQGEADAACMIDGNYQLFEQEGTIPLGKTRVLARTDPYDHCCFTVLEDAPKETVNRFVELLLSMSYDDPEVRPLFDLENLKAWRRGRTEGFAQLNEAVDRFDYLGDFLDQMKS
ncbi:MAG: PhnD/SsuA/transferrin family substrate-binding protein [Pirellulales bacterium]|jgi:phosphonate transport system substrate-binding protein|nr:PhnD/SsuA/transferrin family substrate-binding protein [Pirellulales bacterium]